MAGNTNNIILAVALLLVVIITCITSYFQERSAGNVMVRDLIHGGWGVALGADSTALHERMV